MRHVAASRVVKVVVLLALVAVVVTAAMRIFNTGSDAGADKSSDALLQFIDPAAFNGSAWQLSEPPTDYTPKVSKQAAEDAAKEYTPGVTVRETVLLSISWSGSLAPPANLNGPVWVVNLEPGSFGLVPPLYPCFLSNGERWLPNEAEFMLTFVDPETGEVLSHIQQPDDPPGGITCGSTPTPQNEPPPA